MADSKELQTQLQLQQQINKVLADRAKQMDAITKQISGQAQLQKELCKALECKELDGLEDRIAGISSSLASAADDASKVGGALNKMGADGEKSAAGLGGALGNVLDKITPMKGAAVGAGTSMFKSFKGLPNLLGMVSGGIKSVVGGLFNIGKSIVSIPFKILGGFVSAAAAGSGGVNELRQAMEKLRGEMGDLSTGEGKAVMDGFNALRSSSSALAKSGLSVGQVFGYGPGGAAAMLQAVSEVAAAAGPAFSMLKDQIAGAADKMVMMNKGLGMTNEALAEMAAKAARTGGDVGDELIEMGSMAIQMGNKFGVSAKTIGKNVSALMESMEDFGGMSKKQLTATATYMAKLGLEAKDLQGVIGKFDDFESAAEGVSQLNQAFGIQLDTMEMMNAQNPAERIDQMRNAFHAAGKSVEDMTRAEKKLMAEQMGLSVSAMENALAVENQGIAYEDMEAAAEEAEANKMSEKEVMLELAKSIEKLVHGGSGVTGFFDAFAKGFSRGFKQNQEYRDSIRAIRKSLKTMMKFGREVGKVFADIAKHLGLFKAIKRIFDPKAFSALLGMNGEKDGILTYIKKFRDSTMAGGDYSLGDMVKDIFTRVKKYLLGPGADGAKSFSKFFENAIRFIGKGIASLIPVAIGGLTNFIKFLTAAIKDPSSLKDFGQGATEGIGGAISDAMKEIGPALAEALPPLWEAMKEMFGALYVVLEPFLMSGLKKVILVAVVKAAVGALASAAANAAVVGAIKMFAGMFGKNTGEALNKAGSSGLQKGGAGFFESFGKMVEKIAEIDIGKMFKAGLNLAAMTAGFMPALIAFAATVYVMHAMIGKIPWNELMKVFAVIGVSVLALLGLAIVSLFLEPTTMTIAATFLGISLLFMLALVAFAGTVRLAYEALKPISWGEFGKVMGMLGITILATVALGALAAGLMSFAALIPAMVIGFVAIALLFTAGVFVFGEAIMGNMTMLKKIGQNAVLIEKAVGSIMTVVFATAKMSALGAAFAAIGLFVGFLKRGFAKAADFFVDVLPNIQTMIKEVSKIPMKDPDSLAKRIGIVAQVAESMKVMADIAMDAADMHSVTDMLGGTSMSDMFAAMGGFIKEIGATLSSLIGDIVKLASGLNADELKGVETIAKVMASIATLASALAAPLKDIAELKAEADFFGPSVTEIIDKVFSGMKGLMTTIGAEIGNIVESITKAMEKLTGDPKTLNAKMDVIVKMFDVLGKFAKALSDSSGLIDLTDAKGSFWTKRDMKDRLAEVANAITSLLDPMKEEIAKLVEKFQGIAGTITNPEALVKQMDVVVKMFDVLGKFSSTLGGLKDTFGKDGGGLDMSAVKATLSNLNTAVTGLFAADGPMSLPKMMAAVAGAKINTAAIDNLKVGADAMSGLGRFYSSLVDTVAKAGEVTGAEGALSTTVQNMVAEVNASLQALNNVGAIDAKVALDNFASAVGIGTDQVTIENNGVNITINLTTTMDANKITKVLTDKSIVTSPLASAEG